MSSNALTSALQSVVAADPAQGGGTGAPATAGMNRAAEVPSTRYRECQVCPARTCVARRAGRRLARAWIEGQTEPIAVMPRAAPLFVIGDEPDAVYTVRAGCLKSSTVDTDGGEHIRAFHLPGDVVGFDALAGQRMGATARAIVPSQVCVMPLPMLRRLMGELPELGVLLVESACRELAAAQAQGGNFTAEQRVAAFVLRMGERLGASDGVLRLPMTRRDIGNSLRLTMESVSRTLKAFERKGWLRCDERRVRILAPLPLLDLAEPVGVGRRPAWPRPAGGRRTA